MFLVGEYAGVSTGDSHIRFVRLLLGSPMVEEFTGTSGLYLSKFGPGKQQGPPGLVLSVTYNNGNEFYSHLEPACSRQTLSTKTWGRFRPRMFVSYCLAAFNEALDSVYGQGDNKRGASETLALALNTCSHCDIFLHNEMFHCFGKPQGGCRC